MKSKISITEGTLSDVREIISNKFGTERKFWVLTVNNKDYFMFSYPNLRLNSYIRITYKQSGNFRNVISIQEIPCTLHDFARPPEEIHSWLKSIKEALK